jgi:antitoxin component YwqK of YwqJK toxin-antitoxin module
MRKWFLYGILIFLGLECTAKPRCFYYDKKTGLAYNCKSDSSLYNGFCHYYYLNNKKKTESFYKNGEALYLKFWYKNGQIRDSIIVTDFINYTYEEFNWWRNGNLKRQINFKNRKVEGEMVNYYKNGNIKKVFNFEKDLLVGNYRTYYKNGQIDSEGFFKDPHHSVEIHKWDKNGNIIY